MKSIKVCEYSRSRSFHDDLILQDQASGERSQDQWSSGFFVCCIRLISRNFGVGIYALKLSTLKRIGTVLFTERLAVWLR